MEKYITSINAINYRGTFSFENTKGNFTTDGNKKLTNINGSDPELGSFDVSGYDNEMNYNLSPRTIDSASELADTVKRIVSAIIVELSEN